MSRGLDVTAKISRFSELDLVHIEGGGELYISGDRDDWSIVLEAGISVLIDLDGDIDHGVPTAPNRILYIYFPILDSDLPDLEMLHSVARLSADLCRKGESILTHCKMGLNRSALLLGVILTYLGISGSEAVELLRHKRPGALFNPKFSSYLASLPAVGSRRVAD